MEVIQRSPVSRSGLGIPSWQRWLRQRAFAAWQYLALAGRELPAPQAEPQAAAIAIECEELIERHERQILNYLWRMTGDEDAAYDLTQEVFLRAWQHFDTLRRYQQPRSWLFRVATNLALTHLRRRAMLAGHAATLDEELGPASSDPAWRLAERDLVRRTLLQLSPKRRAALVLNEVYGLTTAEVGRVLGISGAAVRAALHRGRMQFREIYLREGGTDHDR